MASARCPHCLKSLGGPTVEGDGTRVRLGIVMVDDDGRVHGPCPKCKGDVTIANGATLSKSLTTQPVPGIPLGRWG